MRLLNIVAVYLKTEAEKLVNKFLYPTTGLASILEFRRVRRVELINTFYLVPARVPTQTVARETMRCHYCRVSD